MREIYKNPNNPVFDGFGFVPGNICPVIEPVNGITAGRIFLQFLLPEEDCKFAPHKESSQNLK